MQTTKHLTQNTLASKSTMHSNSTGKTKNLIYLIEDVRQSEALTNMSLAVSMFTFQFLPEKDRMSLLQKIYDNLVDGGAFITSENLQSECKDEYA